MTWFRVDDKFAFHQKAVKAGNAAIGVWTRLGAWSSDQLTDGWLPCEIASLIQGTDAGALDQLLAVGLLELDGKNYRLHDFLDWNPSSKSVNRKRKALSQTRSKAGGKGAKARWQTDGPSPDPVPIPIPSTDPPVVPQPEPLKLEPPSAKKPRAKRVPAPAAEEPLPGDWQPTDAHRAFAAKHALDLDTELFGFRGWAEGKTAARWNGVFSTRLANSVKWRPAARGGQQAPPVERERMIELPRAPPPKGSFDKPQSIQRGAAEIEAKRARGEYVEMDPMKILAEQCGNVIAPRVDP